MTPEAWKKLGDLVEQVLSLEEGKRQAFINETCLQDPALKAQVEQFIDTYEQDKGFLEQPPLPGLSLEKLQIPAHRIGGYVLVRPLGKGGMGEVLLAHREDGPITHPVALKLIRSEKEYRDFTLSRFMVEQQILSELVHPNIARMLDAGTSEDGRPFFVMEYVDGLPITQYCDEHQLPINDRLKLFLQVCKAVHFAHQNLVVHRDIKPGNLLVTQAGEVKLLDFGIAKALSPWLKSSVPITTESGFRVLTPPYASPEQLAGKPLTTASDVYSLGVLLYELLTGRRPHRLANLIEYEIVKRVLEEVPTQPSSIVLELFEKISEDGSTQNVTPELLSKTRATSKERLQRKLKGELDHIALMALRKEPERRYRSAMELGEDICRHLDGIPVEAQPDAIGYRLSKFIRRHQKGVVAVASLILLLSVFSVFSLFQAQEIKKQSLLAAEERDRAQLESDKSERIVQLLVDLFQMSNPGQGEADTVKVSDFLQYGESAMLTRLEQEPEVQARMKNVLGRMHQARGELDEGVALLQEAVEQQQELHGIDDLQAILMVRDLAGAMFIAGRRDSALAISEDVVARLRNLDGDIARAELAETLLKTAPRYATGQRDKKEAMLVEANVIIESFDAPDPMQIASAANQLGVYYYNQGSYEKAQAPFEKALHYLRMVEDSTGRASMITAGNLAGVLTNAGKFDEAEKLQLWLLQRWLKNTFGEAFNLMQLGNLYYLKGDWDESEAYMRDAYELVVKITEPGHARITNYAMSYIRPLIENRKYREAEEIINEALQHRRQDFGENSVEVGSTLLWLSYLYSVQQKWDEALSWAEEGLIVLYKHYPQGENAFVVRGEMLKGRALLALEQPDKALTGLQHAHNFRQANESTNKAILAQAQVWLGVTMSRLGKHHTADSLLSIGVPHFNTWPFASVIDKQIVIKAQQTSKATLKNAAN